MVCFLVRFAFLLKYGIDRKGRSVTLSRQAGFFAKRNSRQAGFAISLAKRDLQSALYRYCANSLSILHFN